MTRAALTPVPDVPADAPSSRLAVAVSLLSMTPDQVTGTATYARGVLGALTGPSALVDVTVLANRTTAGLARSFVGEAAAVKVSSHFPSASTRLLRMAAISGSWLVPWPLRREIADAVAVIHYPLTVPVPSVKLASVLSLHDVQHHDLPHLFSPAQRAWRALAYDRAARRATEVVTISQHACDRIVERVGVAADRVTVLPLGVDHDRFTPDAEDDAEILRNLALPDRYVFYPAALWPHKNHAKLLEALARSEDGELSLVLTGPRFGASEQLLAHSARLGLGRRVVHLGLVPSGLVPALYRRAAALVFPSLYEGFGAPLVEAMACGVPVAASRRPPVDEVCGDAALLFDPGDVSEIAGAIDRITADDQLRADLRVKGLARSRDYEWGTTARRLVAVYERAAARHGS